MNNTQAGAVAESINVESSKILTVSKTSESKIFNFGVRLFATVTGKQLIAYPSTQAQGTTNYAVIDQMLVNTAKRELMY